MSKHNIIRHLLWNTWIKPQLAKHRLTYIDLVQTQLAKLLLRRIMCTCTHIHAFVHCGKQRTQITRTCITTLGTLYEQLSALGDQGKALCHFHRCADVTKCNTKLVVRRTSTDNLWLMRHKKRNLELNYEQTAVSVRDDSMSKLSALSSDIAQRPPSTVTSFSAHPPQPHAITTIISYMNRQ